MSSKPSSRRYFVKGSISKLDLRSPASTVWSGEVDGHHRVRVAGGECDQVLHLPLGEPDREKADLGAVVVEDVGVRGCYDRFESPVLDTPGSMLA